MATERTSPITIRPQAIGHEHGWVTESAHRTSGGLLAYVVCAACGARRVDARGADGISSTALTRPLSGRRRGD